VLHRRGRAPREPALDESAWSRVEQLAPGRLLEALQCREEGVCMVVEVAQKSVALIPPPLA